MVREGLSVAGCLLLGFMTAGRAFAQNAGVSLLLKGNYTTSSEIFPNPNSANVVARSQAFAVDGFFGAGFEAKYRPPQSSLAVGLSVEYLRATLTNTVALAFRQGIPVEDGYTVIPVEVTGYFIIPFSGETVQVFMGGGGGIYFGRRTYRLSGVDAPVVDTSPGIGIHVLAGLSFYLTEGFSLVGEMKFRDLQFESTNAFPDPRINYGGGVINVGTSPFDSRVHTDGIVFLLGVAVTV